MLMGYYHYETYAFFPALDQFVLKLGLVNPSSDTNLGFYNSLLWFYMQFLFKRSKCVVEYTRHRS